MSRDVAIGVGCRKGCSADAIEGVIYKALALVSSLPRRRESILGHREGGQVDSHRRGAGDPFEIAGLFTLIDKEGEAGLVEAANRLGLSLNFFSRDALRAQSDRVRTAAPRAQAEFDVPSVAEAAALAGAGPGSVLLVARIAEGGATCAIAGAAS